MRYELKSVGVWAFIKVSFFVNLVFGFLFGLFFALILVPMMSFSMRMSGIGEGLDAMPPIGALAVILPFMFALSGAVFNTILGLLVVLAYNLLANLLGGLEFDLGTVVEFAPVPPPAASMPATYVAPAPPPVPAGQMPPPPPRPVPPAATASDLAPKPEARPETLEETPPAPPEPDEDGPRPDEP